MDMVDRALSPGSAGKSTLNGTKLHVNRVLTFVYLCNLILQVSMACLPFFIPALVLSHTRQWTNPVFTIFISLEEITFEFQCFRQMAIRLSVQLVWRAQLVSRGLDCRQQTIAVQEKNRDSAFCCCCMDELVRRISVQSLSSSLHGQSLLSPCPCPHIRRSGPNRCHGRTRSSSIFEVVLNFE